MPKAKCIDVHSHVLPRETLEAIRQRPRDYQMRIDGSSAGQRERILSVNALQLLDER